MRPKAVSSDIEDTIEVIETAPAAPQSKRPEVKSESEIANKRERITREYKVYKQEDSLTLKPDLHQLHLLLRPITLITNLECEFEFLSSPQTQDQV